MINGYEPVTLEELKRNNIEFKKNAEEFLSKSDTIELEGETMKYLYVDDKRIPTPNANFVAKSYNAAIMYLTAMEFDVVDLDYALDDPNGNGYDLLVYMHEHGIKPGKIVVHSDHSEGRPKMLAFIRENFK